MNFFGNFCRWSRWLIFCATAVVAFTIVASADADTAKKNAAQRKRATAQKSCYTYNSTSASPQPCERIRGQAPTTALPMVVIRYR